MRPGHAGRRLDVRGRPLGRAGGRAPAPDGRRALRAAAWRSTAEAPRRGSGCRWPSWSGAIGVAGRHPGQRLAGAVGACRTVGEPSSPRCSGWPRPAPPRSCSGRFWRWSACRCRASPAAFLATLPAALALRGAELRLGAPRRRGVRRGVGGARRAAGARSARADARGARRGVRRPFRLAPEGPAESAILWKNLILLGRYASLRTLVGFLPVLIVFGDRRAEPTARAASRRVIAAHGPAARRDRRADRAAGDAERPAPGSGPAWPC